MKKILTLLGLAVLAAACKKNNDNMIFSERPEVRTQRSVAQVDSLLGTAPNGWIATLPTQEGGGYGFYMTFDRPNQTVTMYSDIDETTSTTAKQSTYRIKGDGGATLIFDTYNYISRLADPTPSTMGGATGHGFSSDVEFNFVRDAGDTAVFIGKKYRQELKLLKATAAQQAAYKAGDYLKTINQVADYFDNTSFPYVEIQSGAKTYKLGVNLNTSNDLYDGKTLSFTGIIPGDTLGTKTGKYAYTVSSAEILDSGVTIMGTNFRRILMKSANAASVYDKTGKEYTVKSSLQPLVPLYMAFGTVYSQLTIPFNTVYPGTSTNGAALVNGFFKAATTPAVVTYSFNYAALNFRFDTNNKRFTFNGFCSQNGGASGWTTTITYSYNMDNSGIFKFTQTGGPTGGYIGNAMKDIDSFLQKNRCRFDYYISGGKLYGLMASVDDPGIVMTFAMQ